MLAHQLRTVTRHLKLLTIASDRGAVLPACVRHLTTNRIDVRPKHIADNVRDWLNTLNDVDARKVRYIQNEVWRPWSGKVLVATERGGVRGMQPALLLWWIFESGVALYVQHLIARPIQLDIPERPAGRGLGAKPGFDDHRRLSEIADAYQ